ncbi:hypothetical protein RC77_05385 [Pectobacterium brasiliense]|uniref:DUF4238 domain-containing protein n=1 Tax=Pectobacterium brasiliense TaxID=180957 RepID=UPI00057FFA83|nr:DUF4238 domain-containing protein [Pectobacterium brasiliense]KHS70947.1 hypothetical protein RC77_05385 [Pectobacterium brasiliense]
MKDTKKNENRNKNQHYVPENYFLEFSKDGSSVCGLFKKNGKTHKNISFGGQSSDHWFYGDAEREDKITEFDTKYCDNRRAILRDLANGAISLSSEQINILLENTQFQRKRALTFRNAEKGVNEFHENFFKPQIEDLKNYDSGHSEEATEAVKKAMELFFKAFTDPKESQFFNLIIVDTNPVSDLGLVILRNRTSLPFIFSDSPVAYTNPALSDFMCSKVDNNSVGLQIFYPLNSEFLALFYDAAVYQMENTNSIIFDITENSDISQINKLQLHEATNSIYFERTGDIEYVKTLWEEESPSFKPKKKSVASMPVLTPEGHETGNTTLSTTESEPSFYPNLSFITSDLSNSSIPYREAYWRKYNPQNVEIPRLNELIDRHSKNK